MIRSAPRLFIAAAEASGDQLGAALVSELRLRRPDLEVFGLAGPKMRSCGVDVVGHAEEASAVGIVEGIQRAPAALRLVSRLEAAVRARRPAVSLTIDAPSLSLRLQRRIVGAGAARLHWVSPQVWAWRPGRIDAVARSIDTLLCLLPFEPALYQDRVRALFVGHPAAAIRPEPDLPEGGLALCPGSRPSEIQALWPVLREVARRVRAVHPKVRLVVPVASTVDVRMLDGLDCTYVSSLSGIARCDAAVVASGTACLEVAALDVPMVVIYRVHPLTAAIARRLLTVRHVALPNVIAGRTLAPEHLQDLDPDAIARDVLACWGRRGQVPRELMTSLRGEGAITRVTDEVERWLFA